MIFLVWCVVMGVGCMGSGEVKRDEVHHLKGDVYVEGNAIVFLRPDSVRFDELSKDVASGINEVDSDFAFGISNTMDSLENMHVPFKVQAITTSARVVHILGCEGCPIEIDRDTVSYGYILTGQGMKPSTHYNSVHSGDYLQEIRDYFASNELLMFRVRDLQASFGKFELYALKDTIRADMDGDGNAEKIYLSGGQPLDMVIDNGKERRMIGSDESFKEIGADFSWADHWGLIRGESADENVVMNGEPMYAKRVKLGPASIFIRRDESGGGLVTYRNGRYVWVHQAD